MKPESTEGIDAAHADLWSAGHMIGGYRVIRHLGSGGMGHVYEAERLLTKQRVAIKVPRGVANARSTARLLREARYAATIDSRHVARVIDADVDPAGVPFIVMEQLNGETLAERLRRSGKLAWRDAVEIVAQAAEGLSAIHSKGLVHRDLKPSNLFIAREGNDERVKIIDLGLARQTLGDDALTASNVRVVGSVSYAAPEQLEAPSEVDTRADIWSLGVTLHEALTAKLPYRGRSVSETILEILRGVAPRARETANDVPEKLQAIIDECLRRDPSIRLGSASALQAALRALGGQSSEGFFRTGRSFRIVVRDRLFILIWVGMPVSEDVDLVCEAARDARAAATGQLTELVLVPGFMSLGGLELRAGERMVSQFPTFVRDFDQLYLVIDARGFAFEMLRHAAVLIAGQISVPWKIGPREEILPFVAERSNLSISELEAILHFS